MNNKNTGLGKGLDALFGNIEIPKDEERRIGHVYNKQGLDSTDVSIAADLEKTFNYIRKNNPNSKIAYLQLAALSDEDYKYIVEANNGDADAQTNIGYLYENGKGVEQNYDKAMADH